MKMPQSKDCGIFLSVPDPRTLHSGNPGKFLALLGIPQPKAKPRKVIQTPGYPIPDLLSLRLGRSGTKQQIKNRNGILL